MNALEMKLIAMKFALARKAYVPNDKKFTSTSGAYDVGTIQQELSQGVTIDDRDLTITNTVIEDCDHVANDEVVTENTTSNTALAPETTTTTAVPETTTTTTTTTTEPPTQAHTDGQSFGGRIWQYFKDTTNVQPKS